MKNKKKVLVIGATGFLGFHFAKFCLKNDISVISLSRKKPRKIRKLQKIRYVFADITKRKQLHLKLEKLKKIDYVINFGGEVNHKKINETFSSHYRGVINLCNFFIKKDIKNFIQIGSSLEYGAKVSPHKETDALQPRSNYSKAKSLSSRYLINLFRKKNFPISIIRPYQIYGPYQDQNRFLPIIINSCLKNKNFDCSDGKQYRDFLYVEDFVKLVFKIMKSKNCKGEIFNAGFGKPMKIRNIIKKIMLKTKRGYPIFGKIPLRKDENIITYPNISKSFKFLKWKPRINFNQGLNKTINFYKNN